MKTRKILVFIILLKILLLAKPGRAMEAPEFEDATADICKSLQLEETVYTQIHLYWQRVCNESVNDSVLVELDRDAIKNGEKPDALKKNFRYVEPHLDHTLSNELRFAFLPSGFFYWRSHYLQEKNYLREQYTIAQKPQSEHSITRYSNHIHNSPNPFALPMFKIEQVHPDDPLVDPFLRTLHDQYLNSKTNFKYNLPEGK